MEIIRSESLSKVYRTGENKVYALNNVSLSIEQGSFTAITGPSGSGKSTLLHLLSGLDHPTDGKVIYQDADLYKYKDNQLAVLRRRRFGFVFQSYNLVRELTGWENILLPVMLDNRKADEEHLNRIIDLLGIRDRLSHLPGAMSGGQQQRISIARALAKQSPILVLDDSTSALDMETEHEIQKMLNELQDTTKIIIAHRISAVRHADEIIYLENGKIAERGTHEELLAKKGLYYNTYVAQYSS